MSQPSSPNRPARAFSRRLRLLAAAAAAPLLLGGCAGGGVFSDAGSLIETADVPAQSRSIDPSYAVAATAGPREADPENLEVVRAAADAAIKNDAHFGAIAHLSKLAEHDPSDLDIAYQLSRRLRYVGALSDSERVLNDARAIHPDDPLLRLELAKTKIAGGFAQEALLLLKPLAEEEDEDPSVLQALGVAYDRTGQHQEAQAAYAEAMKHGRPSAALLNNDGLSRLISGDVEGAVARLREASTAPGANAQVRQNLALALVLKGDEAEARRVAGAAVPKDIAEKALAYFTAIPAAQDAWGAARDSGL